MAWLRNGDNAATNPRVMALATVRGADGRLMNEAFGFVQRCAMQSAGHMTDGVIDLGTVQLMAPTRWEPLIAACVEAGLLEPRARGRKPTWAIPSDADFIHIRPRAEIEWERQRRRDVANPELTAPVRLRDGDACRYCGHVVNWRQRKGNRRGTYDHREPGKAATYETFVVACFGCNNDRSNDPAADSRRPLLPPPTDPIYTPDTVEFLARHDIHVSPTGTARPASADPAPAAPTEQPGPRATARPASAGGSATTDLQISADLGGSEVSGPGRVGAGRAGSGLDGAGRGGAGAALPQPPPKPPRRRGSRGRRGKGQR